MGWAISSRCDPELVDLCSEMVVGDVSFMPDLSAMFDELRRRGAGGVALDLLRQQMQPQLT